MTSLYLIRHGETAWNQESRFQGQEDIPLSPVGRDQAGNLASRLEDEAQRGRRFAALYASDLGRAVATARPVAQRLGLPVATDSRLREIHGGCWQGLLPAEITERYPSERQTWAADPLHTSCPGGESWHLVQQRAVACLSDLAARHPTGSVLVVTHGGLVRALVGHATGQERWWEARPVRNASITVLEVSDQGWKVIRMNDTAHLGGRL